MLAAHICYLERGFSRFVLPFFIFTLLSMFVHLLSLTYLWTLIVFMIMCDIGLLGDLYILSSEVCDSVR
jgi:hypothetical protein